MTPLARGGPGKGRGPLESVAYYRSSTAFRIIRVANGVDPRQNLLLGEVCRCTQRSVLNLLPARRLPIRPASRGKVPAGGIGKGITHSATGVRRSNLVPQLRVVRLCTHAWHVAIYSFSEVQEIPGPTLSGSLWFQNELPDRGRVVLYFPLPAPHRSSGYKG